MSAATFLDAYAAAVARDAAAAERQRIALILEDPLAALSPRLAWRLAMSEGVTPEQAREALLITAMSAGAPVLSERGAELVN